MTDKTRKSYKDESVDLSDKSSLEVDEEKVKEEKRLKILILNKLLTRLPLLAQIKAWKNSYKLKNEIKQIPNLLYQHNKISKKIYKNLIKFYNHGRKYDCNKRY